MSNQVGDCFKFLWPFQNVRTLLSTSVKNLEIFSKTYGLLKTSELYTLLFDLHLDKHCKYEIWKTYNGTVSSEWTLQMTLPKTTFPSLSPGQSSENVTCCRDSLLPGTVRTPKNIMIYI